MSSVFPRVSVFVPTYNQKLFVREAIDSILLQDYPNLEIVVGDDGSTDGTQLILLEYKEKYPNLMTLLLSSKNEGITANCNRILRRCEGDYIALFAGDDVWHPEKLRKQIRLMEDNPLAAVCATRVEWFNSSTQEVIRIYPPDSDVDMKRMSVMHASAYIAGSGPSLLVRRSAIPKGGYDASLSMVSDWLFFIEILRTGSVIFIDEVLARYRRHAANTSSSSSLIFREHISTMELVAKRYPDMRADVSDYMRYYLRNNVPHIMCGPSAYALKFYCLWVVLTNISLATLARFAVKRVSKLFRR